MKAIEQTPTYLPEVEANPQPSPYADLINVTKAAGREYWQIWNLFAFRPEVTSHLASFTEGVMRSPARSAAALRELIAAYTSWTNDCQFCWRSHAAVAAEMLGSEELVRSVLNDLESSPLPESEKALVRFARKMTTDLPEMREKRTSHSFATWLERRGDLLHHPRSSHSSISTTAGSLRPVSIPSLKKRIGCTASGWRLAATNRRTASRESAKQRHPAAEHEIARPKAEPGTTPKWTQQHKAKPPFESQR